MRRVTLATLATVLVCGSLPAQEPVVPDDPFFPDQLSFHASEGTYAVRTRSTSPRRDTITVAAPVSLSAPAAWAISTGSRDVVVALLDDGFHYDHEDVAPNVWRNPGEVGRDAAGIDRSVNGLDDDGNGYVDDVMGWDFAFEDPDPDPYVFDGMDRSRIQPYWHSIPALGIIGARGDNGIGVAGINWQVSLMLLKIGAQGIGRGEVDSLRAGRAARAIRYAADNGARVINWSGFVSDPTEAQLALLRDAIRYAAERDVLLVVGAGNDAWDLDDEEGDCLYPQCFDLPNLLRVAEVDFAGRLYRYEVSGGGVRGSNWGAERVELAAVGANISTATKGAVSVYATAGGTSNAGPVVAGVAALVLSVRPSLSTLQLRQVLIDSSTPLDALKGRVRSGGVVNARRALEAALALPDSGP